MDNRKSFNLYVFLSTFSRNLIETFIGLILYKSGFSLKEVVLYYFIVNLSSLLMTPFFIRMSKKYSNRLLAIIGIISFSILQILLNSIEVNIWYLLVIALLFSIYRRGYWISRRYYNLKVIDKNEVATKYSIISIFNQLAIVLSSYIGALLLDFVAIKVLTTISIVLFLISLVPLYNLKFKHEMNNEKLELFKTMKKIGFSNMYLFSSYELLNILKFFFNLYVFIYVKNTFHAVGLLSLIVNLSTIIFSYFYGKLLDKNRNYYKLSLVLLSIIFICKLNATTIVLCIISMVEGIVSKMFEISHNKQFILISKKYEYYNYNYVYELIQNLFRTIVVLIALLLPNLEWMIYVTLFFMLVALVFKHEISKVVDYKVRNEYVVEVGFRLDKDFIFYDKVLKDNKFKNVYNCETHDIYFTNKDLSGLSELEMKNACIRLRSVNGSDFKIQNNSVIDRELLPLNELNSFIKEIGSKGYKKVFDTCKIDHHYKNNLINGVIQLQEIDGVGLVLYYDNSEYYNQSLHKQRHSLINDLNNSRFDFSYNEMGIDKLRTLYYKNDMYSLNQNE